MDLVKLINDAIASQKPEDRRNYIGASSIGRSCNRAIWYEFRGAERPEIPPTLQRIFDTGKQLEGMILGYIQLSGLSITRASPKNNMLYLQDTELPIFQGHCDAILHLSELESAIVEIKTANNSSFNQFVKHGLLKWSESYYSQIQAYMGMSSYPKAVILVINKDNAELHHEWIDFDERHYEQLKHKAMMISKAEVAPDKINKSPLFYICSRCSYKSICHGKQVMTPQFMEVKNERLYD